MATARGERHAITSIYYLLVRESPRARLHRNRSAILHYLLDGGPVDYWTLPPGGALRHARLARETGAFFLEVPGLHWKATELAAGAGFALIAEAVVPGFDQADHEFMDAATLQELDAVTQQRLVAFLGPSPA